MTKDTFDRALQLCDKIEILQKQLEVVKMQKDTFDEDGDYKLVSEDFKELLLAILLDNPEGTEIVNHLFIYLDAYLTKQIAQYEDKFSRL